MEMAHFRDSEAAAAVLQFGGRLQWLWHSDESRLQHDKLHFSHKLGHKIHHIRLLCYLCHKVGHSPAGDTVIVTTESKLCYLLANHFKKLLDSRVGPVDSSG